MAKKDNIENYDVQRWYIVKIGINWLPEELKNIKSLTGFPVKDYHNRRVFELNSAIKPEKFIQYPWLFDLLSSLKTEWSKDRILVLQREITAEVREKMSKASEILNILIDTVKESKWREKFFSMASKYRSDILSLFQNNAAAEIMYHLWEFAEWYGKWEITEQDIKNLKNMAELVQYNTPENNAITYIQWTKDEIEEEKNKFLNSWSNVYRVENRL